ncbi:DNA-directed DNA polymerase III [Longilinea arvoryzae]|uniref:DNA-directed DNA polymerase n=1 Tax=Longilinea arvoryzae TaxID=360412 RepID=A0A0S7BL99_9CHLR|nr:DNA polymerase III subunit alpha [Longilinea arvoryzae]GAP15888.1 DNA-directed DNA polymerase III [Longilinea arvoryzae]
MLNPMDAAFVPLNLHSNYSLLEAPPSPGEWVQAASARGLPALALTDHRLLTGAVEFYTACRKAGLQPLLGLDLELNYPDGPRPITLLAAGEQGWPNLCRLSSALMLPGEDEPCLPLATLDAHSTDLLVLAGNLGDPTGRRLAGLAEAFPGRLYHALAAPPGGREELQYQAEEARRLRLPFVAAPPAYYLLPEQAALQRTLAAIRRNCPIGRLAPQDVAPPGAWFLSPEEMRRQYGAIPGALEATLEIAARCRMELPLGQPFYPQVPLPPGLSPQQALRQKAEDGARRLYGHITPAIQARLDHELEVIAGRGFEPVFLIVEEVLNYARRSGTPFSSRGSAASSLVAHCIGITGPDPLALDLYFERFLNPARSTPPDIDTDLCSRRRDAVIRHVFEVYGADRTAMVGIINRFRPRSAVTDAAKANGLAPSEVRALADALPHAFWARRDGEEEGGESASAFAELSVAYTDPLHQRIFQQAQALLRLPRHLSVHAGGLVVGPTPLTDRVPLMRSGSKGISITQLDLEAVEAMGLVKIDLLGIRGLTVLGDVAESLYSWQRTRYQDPLEVLENIPADDPETSARIERGETIGCFQIESPGMRATLRDIHARTPADLMVALALYRPGPLQGGLRDAFVRRFKGEEAVEHIHPALAPLLEDTYGVILYQEQVLRIANQLAGLSLAEADLLRRAMSHFDPGKQMITLREKFIAGAQVHSGVPPETGARVWELMAAFAGYGFPKAHAASYAQVGWRGAWCKTHFPAEFMAAVLANWGGYYSQRVYLSEARRLGLVVRPPHINHAAEQFSVCYPAGEPVLYMGLDQVRGLTHRVIERIRRLRPFSSLDDFLARVDPRRQEAEALARCGAMEGLGNIPALLERITPGGWRAGQPALFEMQTESSGDWSLEQKVAAQQEILGVSLEAHPLELLAERIQAAHAVSTLEAISHPGQRVTVAGLRQVSRRSRTAKGEWMMFLTLEDLDGLLDVVFFPDAYRRNRSALQAGGPWLISGTIEIDAEHGDPVLRGERVTLLK